MIGLAGRKYRPNAGKGWEHRRASWDVGLQSTTRFLFAERASGPKPQKIERCAARSKALPSFLSSLSTCLCVCASIWFLPFAWVQVWALNIACLCCILCTAVPMQLCLHRPSFHRDFVFHVKPWVRPCYRFLSPLLFLSCKMGVHRGHPEYKWGCNIGGPSSSFV